MHIHSAHLQLFDEINVVNVSRHNDNAQEVSSRANEKQDRHLHIQKDQVVANPHIIAHELSPREIKGQESVKSAITPTSLTLLTDVHQHDKQWLKSLLARQEQPLRLPASGHVPSATLLQPESPLKGNARQQQPLSLPASAQVQSATHLQPESPRNIINPGHGAGDLRLIDLDSPVLKITLYLICAVFAILALQCVLVMIKF